MRTREAKCALHRHFMDRSTGLDITASEPWHTAGHRELVDDVQLGGDTRLRGIGAHGIPTAAARVAPPASAATASTAARGR